MDVEGPDSPGPDPEPPPKPRYGRIAAVTVPCLPFNCPEGVPASPPGAPQRVVWVNGRAALAPVCNGIVNPLLSRHADESLPLLSPGGAPASPLGAPQLVEGAHAPRRSARLSQRHNGIVNSLLSRYTDEPDVLESHAAAGTLRWVNRSTGIVLAYVPPGYPPGVGFIGPRTLAVTRYAAETAAISVPGYASALAADSFTSASVVLAAAPAVDGVEAAATAAPSEPAMKKKKKKKKKKKLSHRVHRAGHRLRCHLC